MKNKLRFLLLLVVTIFTFALASCGADGVPNDNFGGSAENNDNNVVVETTRKIYYTANYKIICDDYSDIKTNINNKVNEYAGYVQKSSEYEKYATYVYRIPTDKLNEFLNYIDSFGNDVEAKNINSTDITSQYSEIEAKKEVLTASRKAYLDILDKGGLSMSDIIEIQDKITSLDIQIATIEKEMASYNNLLDYSTVTIDYSVKTKNLSFIAQYGNYIAGFFEGLGKFILYALPFFLCMAAIGLGVLGGVKIKKKIDERKNKE